MASYEAAPCRAIPVTIASGASLSAAIDTGGAVPVRIAMPADWTAADLTFQVSSDGGTTWWNLYDAAGTEYTVTAAEDREILLPYAELVGCRFIKLRSGTSDTPVNQAADRTLTLTVAP